VCHQERSGIFLRIGIVRKCRHEITSQGEILKNPPIIIHFDFTGFSFDLVSPLQTATFRSVRRACRRLASSIPLCGRLESFSGTPESIYRSWLKNPTQCFVGVNVAVGNQSCCAAGSHTAHRREQHFAATRNKGKQTRSRKISIGFGITQIRRIFADPSIKKSVQIR